MERENRELRVSRAHCFGGEISVPGDKSISHRAVMLAALADGTSKIEGFLPSEDCLATLGAMKSLGVTVDVLDETDLGPSSLLVHGCGMVTVEPDHAIDCGNSGTTMRLLSGILAGQDFTSRLIGDDSLSKRPMNRVIKPLSGMGAAIQAEGEGGSAPLVIHGGALNGTTYELPVASAQVKSAILLAGLFAEGMTTVIQPVETRDHTERMLDLFNVRTSTDGKAISIMGGQQLQSCDFVVPGDISSAAFWLAAAAVSPGAHLRIQNVGLNPTRSGILDVLERMGADINSVASIDGRGERIGEITVSGGDLTGIEISGDLVANIIDELPILAVTAALAGGTTVIRDAGELRVKETDRIAAVAKNLQAMGAQIEEFDDGMTIYGGRLLHGAAIDSYGDHRIAMAFAIAGLFADGETIIRDAECIAVSYPGFDRDLQLLSGEKTTA